MYFNDVARTWDDARRWERAQTLSRAIRQAWGDAQNEVLDFGCGTGLLTFALYPYATTIYGYDPSSEMQKIFRSKMDLYRTKNVRLITQEEMKEHTFDVIFSSMVFHHIADIRTELLNLRWLLAPDGRLMLIDLDKDDGAFHRNEPWFNGHNGFDRNEMQRVLEGCGFREVSISTMYEGVRQIGDDPVEYSLFIATARR